MEGRISKRMIGLAMAGTIMVGCISPVSAAGVQEQKKNNNGLIAANLMDEGRTGSVTIHKYDTTSAVKHGVNVDDLAVSTGERNQKTEEIMDAYAVEGVEFSYLYCGQAETYRNVKIPNSTVELVYEVPIDLAKLLGMEEQNAYQMIAGQSEPCENSGVWHYSSDQINHALKEFLEGKSQTIDSNDHKLAKNKLEDYMEVHNNKQTMELTNDSGITQEENMKLGLYLFVETKVPEQIVETVNPWFLSIPFTNADGTEWTYDVQCYPKNQSGNPTLEKFVRNQTENKTRTENGKDIIDYAETADTSEGDVMEYLLVSKLPRIHSKATYLTEYTFTDSISRGISYLHDAKIAFYATENDAKSNHIDRAVEVWDQSRGDYFSQEYEPIQGNNTESNNGQYASKMKISFTKQGLYQINTKMSEYWMVVSYSANVHKDETVVLGDAGNPNQVSLEWRRTSQLYYDTLYDDCKVYTFGLDLMKEFSDEKGDFQNVQFTLFNNTDQYYMIAEAIMAEHGKIRYYISGYTRDEKKATIFSPDEDGKLYVNGLEVDEYRLTEIATDHGYQLLKEPVLFSIQRETIQENGQSKSEAMVDHAKAGMIEGRVAITVVNHKNFLLPKTGGRGIYMIAFIGISLVVVGSIVMARTKKTNTESMN